MASVRRERTTGARGVVAGGAGVPDRLRPDVEDVVVAVASAVSDRLPAVTRGMRDQLGTAIAELVGDRRLLTLLNGAIEGNVATALAMLSGHTPLHEVEVPSAAVAHARQLAQQGVPVLAMVRAYRLGQAYVLEECFSELTENSSDPVSSLAAFNAINARTLAYIDWVSQEVVTVYETERDRWVRHQDAMRVARVHEVLAGQGGDVHDLEAGLRYRLRQHHVAVVLWSGDDAGADTRGRLDAALAALAVELNSAADPLTVATDRSSIWAWFPRQHNDDDPDIERVERALRAADHDDVRVAVGGAEAEIEGFRASHRQALDAQEVLRAGDHPGRRAIGYRQAGVPAAALLASNMERTRTLVHATLGRLAAHDPGTERLRETLLSFLECGSNYTVAAARLTLHKNSVKYRVERAVELRGRPLDDDRIDVELALIACRWLRGPHLEGPGATQTDVTVAI